MASDIQNLLDQILNAIYGEEVRGAIHDSIEQCYEDVSTAKTAADAVVAEGQSVISEATVAIQNANTATANADAATTNANTAAESATSAATAAENAAEAADDVIGAAEDAATAAQEAADAANTAATDANAAASTVQTAIDNANSAASIAIAAAESCSAAEASATTAATSATTAKNQAEAAATSANTAANSASQAAGLASQAAASATTAAGNANTEATNATNAALTATTAAQNADRAANDADGAAERVDTVIEDATAASERADTAATNASTAASNADDARTECETVTNSAKSTINAATAATTRATAAAQSIEGLTVSANTVAPDVDASAEINDVGNHKNIVFNIPRGETGTPFKITGDAYPTLQDLQEAIPNPEVGVMYNVGTAPPYSLYRFTGTRWEDQGTLAPVLDPITNANVDSMWSGTSVSTTRYLTSAGLFYFINDKILSALNNKVDSVSGKGLSTNDLTDQLLADFNDAITNIGQLQTSKVDKIEGKSLSSNDYTTAEKNKLAAIEAQANKTIVDSALNENSANPVQNSVIKENFDSINTSITNFSTNIASLYDSTKTYRIGDLCMYDRVLYKCTTTIGTPEAWNPNHWSSPGSVSINDEINEATVGVDIYITIQSFSGGSRTFSSLDYPELTLMTSEHVLSAYELGDPQVQQGDWSVTTDTGTVTLSGSASGTTSVKLLLVRANSLNVT